MSDLPKPIRPGDKKYLIHFFLARGLHIDKMKLIGWSRFFLLSKGQPTTPVGVLTV